MADRRTRYRPAKEVQLSGRLVKTVDGTRLRPEDFRELINLRYSQSGVRGIYGQTKFSTLQLPPSDMIHFVKDNPPSSALLINSGQLFLQCLSPIPGTGNATWGVMIDGYFEAGEISKAKMTIAPAGTVVATADYKDPIRARTLMYLGSEYWPATVWDVEPPGVLGGYEYDYSQILLNTVGTSNQVAPVHNNAGWTTYYIGCTAKVRGIKFYVSTSNTATGTSTEFAYWNAATNAWVNRPCTDETRVLVGGGYAALNRSGFVRFNSNTDYKNSGLSIRKGRRLYWYRVRFNGVSTTTKIKAVTAYSPWQELVDQWDGVDVPAAAALWYDNAATNYKDIKAYVYEPTYIEDENPVTTYATLSLNSATPMYFGSPVPLSGIKFGVAPAHENEAGNTTMTVEYYNGKTTPMIWWPDPDLAWTNLNIIDETYENTSTLRRTGIVSWDPPTTPNEMPTYIKTGRSPASGYFFSFTEDLPFDLYYYRIKFSGALTGNLRLYYMAGIPRPQDLRSWGIAVNHLNRLWLLNNSDAEPNAVICSASGTSQIFNGDDSEKYNIGGPEAIVAAESMYGRYGAGTYSIIVVCKHSETYAITGESLEDINIFRVSPSIGCIAPRTLCVGGIGTPGELSRNYALWLSSGGPVRFDGSAVIPIGEDIESLFDPESPDYLTAAYIENAYAFIDPNKHEYHLCIGPYEYVYDLRRDKWFQIVRGSKYLTGACAARGTDARVYMLGYRPGNVFVLEDGPTFDGNPINYSLATADMVMDSEYISRETILRSIKLVQVAKSTSNNVTLQHTGDTSTTYTTIGTFSPGESGKRVSDYVKVQRIGPHVFHSFRMSLTNSSDTPGFEPLLLAVVWEPAREDILG